MSKPLEEWSNYSGVLKKMVEEDGEKNVQKLKYLKQSKQVCSEEYQTVMQLAETLLL